MSKREQPQVDTELLRCGLTTVLVASEMARVLEAVFPGAGVLPSLCKNPKTLKALRHNIELLTALCRSATRSVDEAVAKAVQQERSKTDVLMRDARPIRAALNEANAKLTCAIQERDAAVQTLQAIAAGKRGARRMACDVLATMSGGFTPP